MNRHTDVERVMINAPYHNHTPEHDHSSKYDYLLTLKHAIDNPDLNLVQEGQVKPSERDYILDSVDFLVDSDYVAGCGFFQTGSMRLDPDQEAIVSGKIKNGLESGGAVVHLLSIDTLLEQNPGISVTEKIRKLGNIIGVRNEQGQPRAVIISGFGISRFLSSEGLEWLIRDIENRQGLPSAQQFSEQLQTATSLSSMLAAVPEHERGHFAARVLGFAWCGNWQDLAIRKNMAREENIITIVVLPEEALKALVAYQTGGTTALHYKTSDFVFRCREDFANV